jgi:hypothetical protein
MAYAAHVGRRGRAYARRARGGTVAVGDSVSGGGGCGMLVGSAGELLQDPLQLGVEGGEVEEVSRWLWTATRSGVAPVIAYEGGGACEVHSAPKLLEEVREGQEDHRSRQIDNEPPWWHCSPWRGKLQIEAAQRVLVRTKRTGTTVVDARSRLVAWWWKRGDGAACRFARLERRQWWNKKKWKRSFGLVFK